MQSGAELLGDPSLLSQHTESLSPTGLLELWHQFDGQSGLLGRQQRLFCLLSPEQRGALLLVLTEEEQDCVLQYFLAQAQPEPVVQALVALEPDERVDILQHLAANIRLALLQALPAEERQETEFLLPFCADQAAGLMTTRYSVLDAEMSVREALGWIRSSEQLSELEIFYYHYIVDGEGVLQGVLSLKKLLLAADQQRLAEIMSSEVQCVESHAEQEEVMELLEEYDLLAVPVVDARHRILGLVTFDDVMDLIRQEQAHNISNLGGVSGQRPDLMDNFLQAPVAYLLAQRLPWLVVLLLAGTLTSNLLEHFQSFIIAAPVLTLFIPLITQTGGNVGSQSSVLMIRSLSAHNIRFGNLFAALGKELLVALVLALVVGLLVFLRNQVFASGLNWQGNLAIAAALGSVVLCAALIGILIPMLLSALGLDPTVASGPLMATLIDVIGLGLYFVVMQIFSTYFVL